MAGERVTEGKRKWICRERQGEKWGQGETTRKQVGKESDVKISEVPGSREECPAVTIILRLVWQGGHIYMSKIDE